jgi:hypothetical protein
MRAVIFASANVKAKTLLEAKHPRSADRNGVASTAATLASLPSSSEVSSETQGFEPLPKPPLKWAGGKRWLLPYLAPLWQSHSSTRYVEPFCGGLAAPLGLRPKRALLNDINPHLMNFYTQLQRGLEITIEMKNEEQSFYRHRSHFNKLIKDGEWQSAKAAQLFYYLNRTCFNGLCRFNQSGEFNVPFGTHKSITYATSFSRFNSCLRIGHLRIVTLASSKSRPRILSMLIPLTTLNSQPTAPEVLAGTIKFARQSGWRPIRGR